MQMTIGKLWLGAFVLGLATNATAETWSNITTYPLLWRAVAYLWREFDWTHNDPRG
jgi:hypothetical protein